MRWLDTPIPILGNVTPRAACRTIASRRRVAIMIRTMPEIANQGGSIAPPKRELFGELGLEGRACASGPPTSRFERDGVVLRGRGRVHRPLVSVAAAPRLGDQILRRSWPNAHDRPAVAACGRSTYEPRLRPPRAKSRDVRI
jgi:hypothetical protein